MAYYYTCNFPDIYSWIHNLPPISKWKTDSISICISPSCSSQPSLKLSIAKNYHFSIVADYNFPISLWTSKPLRIKHNTTKLLDDESVFNLLINIVHDVLNYGPNKNYNSLFLKIPWIDFNNSDFKEIFNFSFLTLAFLICIYEAPADLRSTCIVALKNPFSCLILTTPISIKPSMTSMPGQFYNRFLKAVNWFTSCQLWKLPGTVVVVP